MSFKFRPLTTAAAAVCIAVALAGCGNKQSAQQMKAPATQVEVAQMQLASATLRAELPGRTSAYRVAEVRPRSRASLKSASLRKAPKSKPAIRSIRLTQAFIRPRFSRRRPP